MATDQSRIPILLEVPLPPPFEALAAQFDGFNSVADIRADVPEEARGQFDSLLPTLEREGKLVWRDRWSPLRWCAACNLPLLQETCDRCGGPAGETIELKFPCNPRPVIPHDEFLFRAVGLPWPVGAGTVINAYRRPDRLGWEIICRGARVGDITHDIRDADPVFAPAAGFDRESFDPDGHMTMEDVVAANRTRLDALERGAVDFIRDWCGRRRFTVPMVTYSGGKDSAVLAHLCHRSGVKMRLVHIDTGIDPPGTRAYIERTLRPYRNLKPMHLGGDDIFWRALERLGPPALDFQWCRIVLKNSAPYRSSTARVAEMLRPLGRLVGLRIILIDGPRRREEPWRIVLKPQVAVVGTPIETLTIRPILDFTDLDVWMYLHRHAIPLHPTYSEEKHQRLVCLFCPDKDRHEMAASRAGSPQQWERFEREVERWRTKLGYPEEWRDHCLWTSDAPASGYARALGIGSHVEAVRRLLNERVTLGPSRAQDGRFKADGTLSGGFDGTALSRWLQPLGRTRRRGATVKVECEEGTVTIDDDGRIGIHGFHADAVDALAALLRDWLAAWLNCIGCGACRSVIDHVRVRDGKAYIKRRCRPCPESVREAVTLCPVNATGLERCLGNKQDS